MAPNSSTVVDQPRIESRVEGKVEYKLKIIWLNVVALTFLHLSFIYGFYLGYRYASWKTTAFSYIYANIGGLGITAGAHRLWCHRSYKAKWPLRVFLLILSNVAGMNDLYEWCRDHRVHHKFTETEADPHNVQRGFFFAHVGWLMCKKHPAVTEKGKTISFDDLLADPVVRFDRIFHIPMVALFSFYIPTMIPVWFWGETLWNSFFIAGLARYCLSMNFAWLVNSAAHYFGDQPYDKYIKARENYFVSFVAIGEGWHNFHHTFPWDYATSELGYTFNFTKLFIDLMAFIGLAYDLKTVHPESVKSKKLQTGDGTRVKHEKTSDEDDDDDEFSSFAKASLFSSASARK